MIKNQASQQQQPPGNQMRQQQSGYGNQVNQKRAESFKPQMPQQNSKKDQLCKFALTNNCHRGPSCSYSHDFSLFPCKYLHGTGMCKVN